MRILMANVRFPRAAQIWVTSRCSNTQFFANCSRVDVSDLINHFFLNQEVPPAHQAAVGHGVFNPIAFDLGHWRLFVRATATRIYPTRREGTYFPSFLPTMRAPSPKEDSGVSLPYGACARPDFAHYSRVPLLLPFPGCRVRLRDHRRQRDPLLVSGSTTVSQPDEAK
jgi:hypothetical protein